MRRFAIATRAVIPRRGGLIFDRAQHVAGVVQDAPE